MKLTVQIGASGASGTCCYLLSLIARRAEQGFPAKCSKIGEKGRSQLENATVVYLLYHNIHQRVADSQ